MAFRNPRPTPPRPKTSGHKDVSGIASAVGGLLGGGGAALGAGADSAGEADIAGGEDASNSASGNTNAPMSTTGGRGVDYSSLIAKPGFWQNLVSKGGAGINYQNILGTLANTQLSGQNQLATGAQSQAATAALSAQKAEEIRQQALADAEARVASADGIDPNDPQAMDDLKNTSQYARAIAAGEHARLSGNMASVSANAYDPAINPKIQGAANAGAVSTEGMPIADYYLKTKTELPLGSSLFGQLGVGNTITGSGAGGTTTTSSKGFQKMPDGTMRSVDNTTTGFQDGHFRIPSISLNPAGDDFQDFVKNYNGGGGGDNTLDNPSIPDDRNDEEQQPAANALQVKPASLPRSSVLAGGIPNPIGSSLSSDLNQMGQGMYQGRAMGGGDMSGLFQGLLNYLRGANTNQIAPTQ